MYNWAVKVESPNIHVYLKGARLPEETTLLLQGAAEHKNVWFGILEERDSVWTVVHTFIPYFLLSRGEVNRLAHMIKLMQSESCRGVAIYNEVS